MMLLPSASEQTPLREKIGDVCFFAEQPPRLYLEEKFKRFEMTARLGHRLSPSIKPMPAEQNSVRRGILRECVFQLCRKHRIVLRVFEERHTLEVRMCRYTREPLQNLIAFEGHIVLRGIVSRDQRIPDRMHVQNGSGLGPRTVEHQMQRGLG